MVSAYRERRDLAYNLLSPAGLCSYYPDGAFYLLVDIPTEATNTYAYARKLLQEADVAVAPGETFGTQGQGRVRISLATSAEQLREGLQRLIAFANAN
jgi:aspartate/methionine/tyrosine aminotransferase